MCLVSDPGDKGMDGGKNSLLQAQELVKLLKQQRVKAKPSGSIQFRGSSDWNFYENHRSRDWGI